MLTLFSNFKRFNLTEFNFPGLPSEDMSYEERLGLVPGQHTDLSVSGEEGTRAKKKASSRVAKVPYTP